ncbi:hypothetical protein BGX23_001509 [Mortierella sp. AD031]|nr:hypothetical protein BGX23_001509 [Mortierella sp. AD031]KAG0217855.1 hypothetical protein BGX33_009427 [Mortierella sp. NVP41]
MNVDPLYHAKLLELRSLKDFAAICQFLHMFHPAFALEDFETEDLEQALVDPHAMAYLVDLQARMLRTLTQERRISFDNWIKYAQKEFEKRAQDQNPWLEEDAVNYESFSLATKLFILSSLCEWQLDDPERFRANFKEEEEVAVEWRVDPIGHDAHDRTYWLFDDNRLYRENPPVNDKKSKQTATKAAQQKTAPDNRRGTRRSARGQKVEESEPEPEFETPPITPGVEWEPVCITQQEWEDFAELFQRSKHPDEKALHNLINDDILPKVLGDFKEKEKEREKLEAIANRKRSSRIVIREFEIQEKARLEALRQQEQQAAAEQRKQELRERRAERERQVQQQVRDNRLKEREERLKARENAIWEREAKKKQQQQRIAKEREDRKKRRLAGGHKDEHSDDEAGHQEEEEEDWVFDCVCGVFGNNLDDGELMIACGKCSVWQHVACLKQEDAAQGKSDTDWESVDFTCSRCITKEKRKVMRKEKKEQKLREEALAGDSGLSVIKEPKPKKVPKEPKEPKTPKAPKEPKKEKAPKEKVPKIKSPKMPKSHAAPLINGHHPHPSAHAGASSAMAYSTQPYPHPAQSHPFQSEANYHRDHQHGAAQALQPYYNGHIGSNGNQGSAPAHYAYQSPVPQQQHHQYSSPPPPHHNQHPQQPYQQPYQPPHPSHYGSNTLTPSYQAYLPSPHNSSMHAPAPQRPHQLGDYSLSQPPPAQAHSSHYSAPYPQDQYKADGPGYSPAQIPPVYVQGSVNGPIHKRVNSADDEMEGVERPSKMMNSPHHQQHP